MVLILLLDFIFGCIWTVGWTHAHTHTHSHRHTYKQLKKFSVFSGFVVKGFFLFFFLCLIPLPCLDCLPWILYGIFLSIFHFILVRNSLNSLNISSFKKQKKIYSSMQLLQVTSQPQRTLQGYPIYIEFRAWPKCRIRSRRESYRKCGNLCELIVFRIYFP